MQNLQNGGMGESNTGGKKEEKENTGQYILLQRPPSRTSLGRKVNNIFTRSKNNYIIS